ncbi:FAD-dependent oxidoreductase, partial [Salmonella sp. s60131]|uniref:FAD-dependent oxidoreductase n=1 Tax=Salmonella sp. s60131 TaxID=3159722 RepID=UPI00397F993C
EFANIFHGLGVDTTLVYRGKEILSRFDQDLRHMLHAAMAEKGIHIRCTEIIPRVERQDDGRKLVHLSGGDAIVADQVMLAIGRVPNTTSLGL